MCGRATLVTDVTEIAEAFGTEPLEGAALEGAAPRFNVAPGQPVLVVRNQKRDPDAPEDAPRGRELAIVKWGLVPRWADSPKIGGRLVQARGETVATTNAYRTAFKYRRALFVADGFYEWKSEGEGKKKVRIPHYLQRDDHAPFAIAALWERWKSKDGEVLETCAVVTTEARGVVASIHDRMPLVLDERAQQRWLAGSDEEARQLAEAAAGAGPGASSFVIVPVSTWVNDVKHDDPRCIEPAAPRSSAVIADEDQVRLRFD